MKHRSKLCVRSATCGWPQISRALDGHLHALETDPLFAFHELAHDAHRGKGGTARVVRQAVARDVELEIPESTGRVDLVDV